MAVCRECFGLVAAHAGPRQDLAAGSVRQVGGRRHGEQAGENDGWEPRHDPRVYHFPIFFRNKTAGLSSYPKQGGRMILKLCALVVFAFLAVGGAFAQFLTDPDWRWRDRAEQRERIWEARERARDIRDEARERMREARDRARAWREDAFQRREFLREQARQRRDDVREQARQRRDDLRELRRDWDRVF
jgi:hypothetical protein